MAKPILRNISIGLAALASLGGAALLLRDSFPTHQAQAPQPRPPQPVRVTQLTFVAAAVQHTFTGTIRPQHEATLSFRLAGKLLTRQVEVGDAVNAGQVVATLDDTDARLELDAARAEQTAATIDRVRAQAEAARARDLFAKAQIAQAALDRAISTLAEAEARADRASRNVSLAANRLSYTTLTAPADGIITQTFAEQGQVVDTGQAVLSLASAGPADVVFALPEQQRDLLIAAKATASLWGAEGQTYTLTLRDIAPDTDPAGRTYRVRMTLPEAAFGRAAFGRTVTVTLTPPAQAPVAVLPLAAVLNDGTGASVWRIKPGASMVERVPVQVVRLTGEEAQIRGPLAPGDTVVSLGAYKLDPNRPVRIVETTSTAES